MIVFSLIKFFAPGKKLNRFQNETAVGEVGNRLFLCLWYCFTPINKESKSLKQINQQDIRIMPSAKHQSRWNFHCINNYMLHFKVCFYICCMLIDTTSTTTHSLNTNRDEENKGYVKKFFHAIRIIVTRLYTVCCYLCKLSVRCNNASLLLFFVGKVPAAKASMCSHL